MNQIYNLSTISARIKQLNDQTIVFTNGCFDLLHPGHIDYLTNAKALGDHLIVGINSDDSVRELKGPSRPINNEEFRAKMLLGLTAVDTIVVFEQSTPIKLIDIIKPQVHVKGGDYIADQLPEYNVVTANGGEVKILPFLEGYSSTSLINKIKSQG